MTVTQDPSQQSLQSPGPPQMPVSSTLDKLQTDEQRRVLDTITQVRKCGLESVVSLPQIVVCGDQSAGKSSVLEALTEIPFPRNDNLCTRFATEISLRREPVDRLTVKVIPDGSRPRDEQQRIQEFSESITDFADLPIVINAAMKVMGISDADVEDAPGRAFAKDTLSIGIDGPSRPQLTLVDIPGLIQASTKGVSATDVAIVGEITDHYISQPRTICLAVISATNDAANQPILERVRKFDPHGERTLGVITKPDRLPKDSGSESKFLELARNEDVFFKLGWHVIKNRAFEERDVYFEDRNNSEMAFFRTSNFKTLPRDTVGIDALRSRLSHLLFAHVKREMPRLEKDMDDALKSAKKELALLGGSRATPAECRSYLTQLNIECSEICKAALNGSYEHDHFKAGPGEGSSWRSVAACLREKFPSSSKSDSARLRAAVQHANNKFAEDVRTKGHKYQIGGDKEEGSEELHPEYLSKEEAMTWVQVTLILSRGTELAGTFNPYLISALFWEMSERWPELARDHIEQVSQICEWFLGHLLEQKASEDVKERIWTAMVSGSLKERRQAALAELEQLEQDRKDVPINYNHYYTDVVQDERHERLRKVLQKVTPDSGPYKDKTSVITAAVKGMARRTTPDMDNFSCEEALDCLGAIYKVQRKTFVANLTTQVIERHLLRGLHRIFLSLISMPDAKLEAIASEPPTTKRQRAFLFDRIRKLEDGHEIIRGVMGYADAS